MWHEVGITEPGLLPSWSDAMSICDEQVVLDSQVQWSSGIKEVLHSTPSISHPGKQQEYELPKTLHRMLILR